MLLFLRLGSVGLLLGFLLASDVPRVTLNAHQSVALALTKGSYQHPIKCDHDGNIYVRLYQDPNPLMAPISKIGPDGRQLARFSFDHIDELGNQAFQAADFVVGARGEVYALAETGNGGHLITFGSDGTLRSITPLLIGRDLELYRILRLMSGQFLVTALQGDERKPRTFILDDSGKMVRFIDLKETSHTDKSGKISSEDITNFELSDVITDDSGQIYILRPSTPASMVILSPSGEFLRSITIDAPAGAHYAPFTLGVSGGRIAVIFRERLDEHRISAKSVFRVLDAGTGLPLVDYVPGGEVKGGFACYVAPAQFSMLMPGDDGRFRLLKLSSP
jgi:hypothetical protein